MMTGNIGSLKWFDPTYYFPSDDPVYWKSMIGSRLLLEFYIEKQPTVDEKEHAKRCLSRFQRLINETKAWQEGYDSPEVWASRRLYESETSAIRVMSVGDLKQMSDWSLRNETFQAEITHSIKVIGSVELHARLTHFRRLLYRIVDPLQPTNFAGLLAI